MKEQEIDSVEMKLTLKVRATLKASRLLMLFAITGMVLLFSHMSSMKNMLFDEMLQTMNMQRVFNLEK
jgi:hypothetical protein